MKIIMGLMIENNWKKNSSHSTTTTTKMLNCWKIVQGAMQDYNKKKSTNDFEDLPSSFWYLLIVALVEHLKYVLIVWHFV